MMMAAFSLTSVLGMSGLAVEIGNGYSTKVRNQRVADMAALGAAVSYQANSDAVQATKTAKDIVVASGLPVSAATVTFGVSVGSTSGIQVQVMTAVPVRIASVITKSASYNVSSSGIASIGGSVSPPCVLALSKAAGTGIEITGSSKITATGCAVTSNSAISVKGSSDLTADTVTAPSITTIGNSDVHGTKVTGSNASDPLAGSTALAAAFAKLGVTTPVVMPNAPTFTSTTANWTFPSNSAGYSALAAADPVKANCSLSGQNYSCSQGTYNINNLTIPSGMTVTFAGTSTVYVYGTFSADHATLAGNQTTYNFRNGFSSGGTGGPSFGDIASLYVGGAVSYNGNGNAIGSGNITFSGSLSVNGSLAIGAGTHAFGGVSVGGGSTLTVGAGGLTVNGSIQVGGNARATFGDGTSVIGNDGHGTAIDVQGSGSLTMGAGDFSADGDISTAGSSTINIGAGKHSIDGSVRLQGGGTLGAGLYIINGDFYKSASETVTANDVTIVAAGNFYTGGSAGVVLTAPANDSSANGGIGGIAFASKTSQASTITGSSSNTLSGIFYLPNSDLSVSGAGSVAGTTCYAIVANTVSVTGSGGIQDTNCNAPKTSSNTSVALIQ